MRLFCVADYDDIILASFSTKKEADDWMKEANKCDEYNGPLSLKILVPDTRIGEKATKSYSATIQIETGKIVDIDIDGIRMWDGKDTFKCWHPKDACFIQGRSFIGKDHLHASLTQARETYCKDKVQRTGV